MKNQNLIIVSLFILFALPIPFSLLSWIGTMISVANMGMTDLSVINESIALFTMLLAGTYLVTYIISLIVTIKNRKITFISFLPVFHIILFSIFLVLWM